ncbi:histidine kinase [Microbacterium sp. NPDC089189]|uniref:sensor histidine kinase n=1 Tax=Microbacterium sp. NPDC089189 TaxID=3154972 RepID=UPI003447EE93
MSAEHRAVVGREDTPSDDGLLLPRPPGVIRRYWARHPRFADVLICVSAFILSVPRYVTATDAPGAWQPAALILAVAIPTSTAVALFWRRRYPIAVYAVAVVPCLLAPPWLMPSGAGLAFALYAVAVYRSSRATGIAFGTTLVLFAVAGLARIALGEAWSDVLNAALATLVVLIIGALIGINVGGRKRYVDALIDRSRQLRIERDQQSQLAAAAERTRIAREMHDIVSHSLTVVVALSEGAAATSDPERARSAARTAADTARDALIEMRAMLGVLRTDDTGTAAPLAPAGAPSPREVVTTAQRAGYPVALRVTGIAPPLAPAADFALGRVVQEGVTNAMRHAPRATRATVAIHYGADAVEVTIINDGVRTSATGTAGFGLQGLTERVTHAGGHLDVRSADGVWTLAVTLPLTTEDTA